MIQTLTMLMKQYNFIIFKILQVAADHCQFLRDSKALKQGSPLTRSHACLGAALFCRLPSARWCLQCSCCAPAWLAEKLFLPSLACAVKGRLRCVCGPPAGSLKWSLPSAVLFTNDSSGIEERQIDFVSRVYRGE